MRTWWISQTRAVRSTEPDASFLPVQFHATECTCTPAGWASGTGSVTCERSTCRAFFEWPSRSEVRAPFNASCDASGGPRSMPAPRGGQQERRTRKAHRRARLRRRGAGAVTCTGAGRTVARSDRGSSSEAGAEACVQTGRTTTTGRRQSPRATKTGGLATQVARDTNRLANVSCRAMQDGGDASVEQHAFRFDSLTRRRRRSQLCQLGVLHRLTHSEVDHDLLCGKRNNG